MAFTDGPLWARSKKAENFWGTFIGLIRYMGRYRLMLYLGILMIIIALLLLVPLNGQAAPLGNVGVVLAQVLMYVALVLTVVSGADYIIRNRDCIKDM